jgi:hypothetical protein
MNIKNILIITVLLSSGSLLAQNQKINLGIQGGPSATFLWGIRALPAEEIAQNFTGGFTFQYTLNRIFSLRTELSYARKGNSLDIQVRNNQGNLLGNTQVNSNFDYLTLPILARASFGSDVQFFIHGGPYLGFLLKQTTVQKAFDNNPELKIDNTDQYRSIDLGATVGLGITIPFEKDFLLSLELRNNIGLINIGDGPLTVDNGLKTYALDLLVGFAYQFGGRIN